MKKHILLCAALALSSFGLPSCSDILDQKPLDSYTDTAVWGDLSLAESFLNYCYLRVEAENTNGVMFCNYTDETYHMHDYGTSTYTQGRASCDNYNTGWTEGKGNTWSHYYGGIKLCNQLLEDIMDTPANTDSEKERKNQIIGQGYFLRAYYYHMLYSVYGRIPLIDHTYDLDSEFKEERADMDDVADFIVADCDKAAELLPTVYKDASDFGRATKGAALALKGRVLLYKASPLFGTPSREKWQAAADANKAVIDMNIYSLKQVSNSDEYADLFFDSKNPEVIFEKLYDEKGIAGSSASLVMQAPAGPGNGYEGWSTWQPTYEIVELFQNADGTPYKPAETKPFTILQTTIDPDSGEATQKEVTIQASDVNPWEGREIRLKANILYDGMLWGYGDSNREIELFEAGAKGVIPGKDSRTGETWWNGTKTGYNMRKFLSSHINFYDDTVVDTTPWFFIRLAEVYLNYAECQIELGNNAEALKYINLIRNRALLPDATGKDIRTEYEYERTVELMFEGQRFFDLRRWKKMEETYSKEHWPTGLKIYKLQNGTKIYYHNPEAVQQRNFDASKNYWWPIPRYELNKSTLLDAAPYE